MCICYFVLLARFMQLIQREWLDGGHPFSMRHNHVTSAPEKEKAPMFLLFLDAVWQVRLSQSHVYNNNVFAAAHIMPALRFAITGNTAISFVL